MSLFLVICVSCPADRIADEVVYCVLCRPALALHLHRKDESCRVWCLDGGLDRAVTPGTQHCLSATDSVETNNVASLFRLLCRLFLMAWIYGGMVHSVSLALARITSTSVVVLYLGRVVNPGTNAMLVNDSCKDQRFSFSAWICTGFSDHRVTNEIHSIPCISSMHCRLFWKCTHLSHTHCHFGISLLLHREDIWSMTLFTKITMSSAWHSCWPMDHNQVLCFCLERWASRSDITCKTNKTSAEFKCHRRCQTDL